MYYHFIPVTRWTKQFLYVCAQGQNVTYDKYLIRRTAKFSTSALGENNQCQYLRNIPSARWILTEMRLFAQDLPETKAASIGILWNLLNRRTKKYLAQTLGYLDAFMTYCHLTHRDRVTYICVTKLNDISSDNGILLMWPSGSNFNEMFIEILIFSFKKIYLRNSGLFVWSSIC